MCRRPSRQPDDWVNITDPTERRRAQNRIAQRNYRKKLKKGLEEGKKLKKRLEEAEGIIASGSHSNNNDLRPHVQPAPPLPKGCIETGTADLHRNRSSQLEDDSVVPAQQCKGGSSDALLPAVYSTLPTTGRIAGNTAQNTNPSIPLSHPSTSIAVGMATPLAIECFPPNLYYANVGGSPFDEGYLAMNGYWAASHYQYM